MSTTVTLKLTPEQARELDRLLSFHLNDFRVLRNQDDFETVVLIGTIRVQLRDAIARAGGDESEERKAD